MTEPQTYVLRGRFRPYVRMTQRGKWVRPEAQAYLESKAHLAAQYLAADNRRMPPRTPLYVVITVEMAGGLHRCDVDNQVKAILDAGNGVAWDDDRWIDQLIVKRRKAGFDRVTVIVEPL